MLGCSKPASVLFADRLEACPCWSEDHTLECIRKASFGFSAQRSDACFAAWRLGSRCFGRATPQGHLLEEIRLLQERLDLLGGKNWQEPQKIVATQSLQDLQGLLTARPLCSLCLLHELRRNLLAYALKYMQTTEIGEIVVDAFPDSRNQNIRAPPQRHIRVRWS